MFYIAFDDTALGRHYEEIKQQRSYAVTKLATERSELKHKLRSMEKKKDSPKVINIGHVKFVDRNPKHSQRWTGTFETN